MWNLFFIKSFFESFCTLLTENNSKQITLVQLFFERFMNYKVYLTMNWIHQRNEFTMDLSAIPVGISLFKFNNRNTRTMCEICSKFIIKTTERCHDVFLLCLLLNLNRFHTLFWCFYWLWTSKCRLGLISKSLWYRMWLFRFSTANRYNEEVTYHKTTLKILRF